MVKLLYLLAGIALKQTVDEVKALVSEYVDYLKRRREALSTYTPVPALERGSREEFQFRAQFEHQARVAPAVSQISRKILLVRIAPLIVYALVTIGIGVWIVVIETSSAAQTP